MFTVPPSGRSAPSSLWCTGVPPHLPVRHSCRRADHLELNQGHGAVGLQIQEPRPPLVLVQEPYLHSQGTRVDAAAVQRDCPRGLPGVDCRCSIATLSCGAIMPRRAHRRGVLWSDSGPGRLGRQRRRSHLPNAPGVPSGDGSPAGRWRPSPETGDPETGPP